MNQKITQISLKAARINANLKQEDVAKVLKVSAETVRNYESGKTKPDIHTAYKLAEIYGVSIDNIFFA